MAEHHVRNDIVASTRVGSRAVVELLAQVDTGGEELAWPVAVVAESQDDRSMVFRTYCSQWPVDGRRHLRPPIHGPVTTAPADVVDRYHRALDDGDAEAIVRTFEADGYLRAFVGPGSAHRGYAELRSHFARVFSEGGDYERGPDGLLAAARIYDDVEPPTG